MIFAEKWKRWLDMKNNITDTKKAAHSKESDPKKVPTNNSKTLKNNHPAPSRKSAIDSYLYACQFFKEREKYHQNASIWYLGESELMLEKAVQHEQKAEICADSYSQYLQLAGVATLKSTGVCP